MTDIFDEPGEPIDQLESQMRDAEAAAPEEVEEVTEETPAEAPVTPAMVPVAAVHEARAEARNLRSEVDDMRAKLTQFEQLRAELDEQRRNAQAQQQDTQFETDPLGAMRSDLQEIKRQQFESQSKAQQDAAEAQARAQLEQQMSVAVQQFVQQTPDYGEALNHVVQTRAAELRAMGMDDAQIPDQINMESMSLAQQHGANAPNVVYQIAKAKGYAMTAKPSKSLDQLETAQKAASTLSDTQGTSEPDALSLKDVDKMSDDEFDKLFDEISKDARKRGE